MGVRGRVRVRGVVRDSGWKERMRLQSPTPVAALALSTSVSTKRGRPHFARLVHVLDFAPAGLDIHTSHAMVVETVMSLDVEALLAAAALVAHTQPDEMVGFPPGYSRPHLSTSSWQICTRRGPSEQR